MRPPVRMAHTQILILYVGGHVLCIMMDRSCRQLPSDLLPNKAPRCLRNGH